MKKELKQELITLGEKLMLLKQQEVKTEELKNLARQLYEKLTILDFTERNLSDFKAEPTEEATQTTSIKLNPGKPEAKEPETKKEEERTKSQSREEDHDEFAPNGMEYNRSEALTEPNTEKIKDIVAQMPPETQRLDDMLEHILPAKRQKNDVEDIGGVHYDQLPQFEPVETSTSESDRPKSLNDRLKKGIHIGLNDRHAFIKHLFGGSTADYNRVLSQLNTIKTKDEAVNFVLHMVKPDYNNWEGKEDCENRFLDIIENKFD